MNTIGDENPRTGICIDCSVTSDSELIDPIAFLPSVSPEDSSLPTKVIGADVQIHFDVYTRCKEGNKYNIKAEDLQRVVLEKIEAICKTLNCNFSNKDDTIRYLTNKNEWEFKTWVSFKNEKETK